jgi:hypothetical protein
MVRAAIDLSPFDHFLSEAVRLFGASPVARTGKAWKKYGPVVEDRRFYFDILNRVETLAFAFARLKELAVIYRDARRDIEKSKRPVEGKTGTFETSNSLEAQRLRAELEGRTLTSFIYYELASLKNALEKLGIGLDGELEYAVKARNRFLAHPGRRGPFRNSANTLATSEGGLLLTHAINPGESDPRMFEFYLDQDFHVSMFEKAEAAERKNRELLMAGKKESWSDAEKSNFAVFGFPEPNLDLILSELATLLNTKLLPKIERAAKRPITVGN